jgi:hypothetical protein
MGFSKLIAIIFLVSLSFACSKEYVASSGYLDMKVDQKAFVSNSVYGQLYKDKSTDGIHFQNRYIFGTDNLKDNGFNFRLELTSDPNDSSLKFSNDQLNNIILTLFGEQNNSTYFFSEGYADIIQGGSGSSESIIQFSIKLKENRTDSLVLLDGTFNVKNIEQYDSEVAISKP